MDLITSGNGIEVLLRWFHVLSGVTWIGVLYYFNFIQTPFFGSELGGGAKGAMTRGLVPNALWWFRWGAMFTFLTGWCIVFYRMHLGIPLTDGYMTKILTGGLMGTLMWANVWFVIWPAQQVVIKNAEQVAGGGEPIPEAAARGGKAGMASRTNTLFSIPMLFFMISAANLPGGGLIVAVEINGLIGPGAASQKPLTTVSGTIHGGLALWLVLYLVGAFLNS
jgi:uncharacterized membrane protein